MFTVKNNLCIGCGMCTRVCPMGVLRMENGNPATQPGRRCIQCMHCTAVCRQKAIHFDTLPEGSDYARIPDSELERIVQQRRSVRRFTDRLPDCGDISRALHLGMYAPSGKNRHENGWTVLYGRDTVRNVTEKVLDYCRQTGEAPELPKLYAKGTDLICCGASCVIVGWSPDAALNPIIDPAIALYTAELILVQQGYATCWGGYLRQVTEQSAELQKMLRIPEGASMRCAMMVGYAAPEETYVHIPYRPDPVVQWVGLPEREAR